MVDGRLRATSAGCTISPAATIAPKRASSALPAHGAVGLQPQARGQTELGRRRNGAPSRQPLEAQLLGALSNAGLPRYQVRRSSQGLTVKRGGLLWANVRATHADGGTTFKVHGGGLILNRLYSEVALAGKISEALDRSRES